MEQLTKRTTSLRPVPWWLLAEASRRQEIAGPALRGASRARPLTLGQRRRVARLAERRQGFRRHVVAVAQLQARQPAAESPSSQSCQVDLLAAATWQQRWHVAQGDEVAQVGRLGGRLRKGNVHDAPPG